MSAPLTALVNVRLPPDERDALHRMAQECNVTLSWAIREGTRMYLQEQLQKSPPPRTRRPGHAT